MAKYYHEVKRFIESKYPEFRGNISGGNYPPSDFAILIATLANYLWLGGIALLLAGDIIFNSIGIIQPSWYISMKNNKVAVFMGLFLVNSIATKLMTTGAFEIILNDHHTVFSRLQSGGELPYKNTLHHELTPIYILYILYKLYKLVPSSLTQTPLTISPIHP